MTTRIFSNPRQPLMLKDGVTPNAFGEIYFYEPGAGSTTDKYVYSAPEFIEANRLKQPIDLDGAGIPPSIYLNGDYRVVTYDRYGNKLDDEPNYQPPSTEAQFDDWFSATPYSINDFVRGSNGKYYQSLSSNNRGNDPVSSPQFWVEKFFQDVWSQYKTYPLDEIVTYQGDIWVSQSANNTGNTPSTSSSFWRSFFEPSTATDYIASSFSYFYGPGAIGFPMSVSTEITPGISSFETVGPTGSGADYEWSALDLIDSDAKAIEVSMWGRVERSSGVDDIVSLLCYMVSTDYTGIPSEFTEVFNISTYGGTTITARIVNRTKATVALDSNRTFSIAWLGVNDTLVDLKAYITGYMR